MAGQLSIRSGRGLGDTIYLQSVVRWLVLSGHHVEACSDFPDLFRTMPRVKTAPFRKDRIDRLAHYAMRKKAATNQFADCCIQAGIPGDTPLWLDWTPSKRIVAERYVVVQMPRAPFGRTDGYGMELLPRWELLQRAIDNARKDAVIVQVGSGKCLHQFTGIDIDLANKTTVPELLDVACFASGFIGYVSFIVPLAEGLGKPLFTVWSRKALKSRHEYVRLITPQKIFTRAQSIAVWDDYVGDIEVSAA